MLTGFVGSAFMFIAHFLGAVLGGLIVRLSFDTGTAGTEGIVMCLLSKLFLMALFVPIYTMMGVIGRQKTWMAMRGSFAVGMLLFMMIPSLTPLDSTVVNVVSCLIAGVVSGF